MKDKKKEIKAFLQKQTRSAKEATKLQAGEDIHRLQEGQVIVALVRIIILTNVLKFRVRTKLEVAENNVGWCRVSAGLC